jgi:hypothetical protein
MVFDKAPLGEVLAALTKDAEFNLSIETEIDLTRPVTVHLKNVTLQEALDMIVVTGAGYAWTMDKGTLAVKRFAERVYYFEALDMVGETSIDVGGDMLGSGVENAGVAGKYQVKAQKPQQSSDLWAAVEQALGGLKSADGILRLNRNSGIIFMADLIRAITIPHEIDFMATSSYGAGVTSSGVGRLSGLHPLHPRPRRAEPELPGQRREQLGPAEHQESGARRRRAQHLEQNLRSDAGRIAARDGNRQGARGRGVLAHDSSGWVRWWPIRCRWRHGAARRTGL